MRPFAEHESGACPAISLDAMPSLELSYVARPSSLWTNDKRQATTEYRGRFMQ
jgi:hypothetical protein